MSNFVNVRIRFRDMHALWMSDLDASMTEHSIKNSYAIHFLQEDINDSEDNTILLRLADRFLVQYCERFLEPPLYTREGTPILDTLRRDLDKVEELLRLVFSHGFVQCIELAFSCPEVNEDEYPICACRLDRWKQKALEYYLEQPDFPTVKFFIER